MGECEIGFGLLPHSGNNVDSEFGVQRYVFNSIKKRPIPNFGSGLITNSENSKNSKNSKNSEFSGHALNGRR